MRMILAIASTALLLSLGTVGTAGAELDGKALFGDQCSKCHGMDGMSDTEQGKKLKVPHLAGDEKLKEPDAVETVKKYVRENKKHKLVSKKVSDDELQAIAEFVRTLGG